MEVVHNITLVATSQLVVHYQTTHKSCIPIVFQTVQTHWTGNAMRNRMLLSVWFSLHTWSVTVCIAEFQVKKVYTYRQSIKS